jgi:hypothetical protein
MSCQRFRHTLLASERPDKPAAAEARHLAGCADCRAWLRRLVRLEQQISLVPVPPSAPPAALLAMLQSAPADALVKPPVLFAPRPRREVGHQKLSLAIALAAALVLFVIGWWAALHMQKGSETIAVNFDSRSHDERIAQVLRPSLSPPHRVSILIDQADDFFKMALVNPDDFSNVRRQADRFHRLVTHNLPPHAHDVSPGERAITLKAAADRLGKIKDNAAHLADQWKSAYPKSVGAMIRIATDAGAAENQLRQMIPV